MVSTIIVSFIALLHIYIMYLEMFLWTKPKGLQTFGNTQQSANDSKTLAANQGLYNGFLAAGLIWGLLYPNTAIGNHIQLFFVICVFVAGIYGGLTVKRSILIIQSVPALIAGFCLIFLG
jgi:putative membrane protein